MDMHRIPRGPCALLLLFAALAAVGVPARPVGAVAPTTCFGEIGSIIGDANGDGKIIGTAGRDIIIGTNQADFIDGLGGNDVICAYKGDDTVEGGSGNDLIFGEWGSDNLKGEAGNDDIFGDADDTAVNRESLSPTGWFGQVPAFGACATSQPSFGADTLTGGTGNDALLDVCGNNTALGGAGSDRIELSGTGKGEAGDDPLVTVVNGLFDGGAYVASADGGSGDDQRVFVHGGIAVGGSGNDGVFAEHTGSEARGGSGNDSLHDVSAFLHPSVSHDPITGNDQVTLNGGSGNDTCQTDGDDVLISCQTVQTVVP